MSLNTELNKNLKKSLDGGRLTAHKFWKFIHRLNSFKKERLERTALIYQGKSSPSVSNGKLGDITFFDLIDIEDVCMILYRSFICRSGGEKKRTGS